MGTGVVRPVPDDAAAAFRAYWAFAQATGGLADAGRRQSSFAVYERVLHGRGGRGLNP